MNKIAVYVHLDAEDLRRQVARGGDIAFAIHFRADGRIFPDASWSDYGATMLGLWLVQVESLIRGADAAELLFLDAGTSLHVRRRGVREFNVTSEKAFGHFEVTVNVDTLAMAIVEAARKVRGALRPHDQLKYHVTSLTEGERVVLAALGSRDPNQG